MMQEDRAYPRTPTVRRERLHRRALVFGMAGLLLLSMSPIFGHHVPTGAETYLAGRESIWALCLVALHLLMAPVHEVFHLLLLGGLVYALFDRVRAWRSLHHTLGRLPTLRPRPGDPFWVAAFDSGLSPRDLRVVRGLPTPAFTAGWRRPTIYVAEELAERLSSAELAAVIAHEAAHVRRRDPMRLSFLRFLACTLFWLKAVRDLAEDMADDAEIRADDVAARQRPLALASALVGLAQWNRSTAASHGAVAFNERDLFERRVRRLAGEEVSPRSRITLRSMAWAALALAFAWTSGAVMAHPLSGDSSLPAEHCEHHSAAISHLFCFSAASPSSGCPHRVHEAS